jgi:thiamine pyrophosphokinase
MNARVVIVAGGGLTEADFALIESTDFLIGVDSGAVQLLEAGWVPHRAVGDFDTAGPEAEQMLRARGVDVRLLPSAKDVTDTQDAVDQALARAPQEILLLGALGGGRFDHALANVHLLERMEAAGVRGIVQNRCNRIRLHTGGTMTVEASSFRYVSLLALSDRVDGITLSGFRYPLNEATLTRDFPLGISNELTGAEGWIRMGDGKLLVIESRDAPS